MNTLLSYTKKIIQWCLYAVLAATVYVTAALLLNSLDNPAYHQLPMPAKDKTELLLKLFAASNALLALLAAWLNSRVNIELFSCTKAFALGYLNTFCNLVVPKKELMPCYIFLPDQLAQLGEGAIKSLIKEITNKNLTCVYNEDSRVYVITNPANGKVVYLDFPSTLKTLAAVVSANGKPNDDKFQEALERKLIGSFKSILGGKLGITYEEKSWWAKITGRWQASSTPEKQNQGSEFHFTDSEQIIHQPLAGFGQLADK